MEMLVWENIYRFYIRVMYRIFHRSNDCISDEPGPDGVSSGKVHV